MAVTLALIDRTTGSFRPKYSALPLCHELGILTKLNLLFYVGENAKTLSETFNFLNENLSSVQALSAYPLLLYPGSRLMKNTEEILNNGGSIIQTKEWVNRHLFPVDASPDFSYEELQNIGILFGKAFQTMRTFYLQKSQGYFSPGTQYHEFERIVESIDIEKLPFSLNEREMAMSHNKLQNILFDKHIL